MNDRAHLNHQLQRGACFRCRPVSPAGLEPVFALFFTGTSDDSALSYGTTNFKLLDCLWRPSDRPSDTCSATCQNSKEAFSESAEGLGGGFLSRTCFSPVLYRQIHRENPVGARTKWTMRFRNSWHLLVQGWVNGPVFYLFFTGEGPIWKFVGTLNGAAWVPIIKPCVES